MTAKLCDLCRGIIDTNSGIVLYDPASVKDICPNCCAHIVTYWHKKCSIGSCLELEAKSFLDECRRHTPE
jgi:hypothetical protein